MTHVIITGAGTGIGRATARAFASSGAEVLAVGRRLAPLEETASGFSTIQPLAADITSAADRARIASALPRVDVLVNNAAIVPAGPLGSITQAQLDGAFATNLFAPIHLTQLLLPSLTARKGVVVNISTAIGGHGWPNNSVYGATKVALDFLTRTWAVELAAAGVRVVGIAPGVTDTPVLEHNGFSAEQKPAVGKRLLERIPLGRIARPEEVAYWIVQATRPEASYATGYVLPIDGGGSVS